MDMYGLWLSLMALSRVPWAALMGACGTLCGPSWGPWDPTRALGGRGFSCGSRHPEPQLKLCYEGVPWCAIGGLLGVLGRPWIALG